MYWRKEEDAEVEKHVKNHGEGDWKKVAELLGVQTAASNHLKPGLEHKDITDEEFIAIIHLHKKYGNQWAKIAKKLSEARPENQRTANKIKNFWNGPVQKKALALNVEVDSEVFITTMTNILRGVDNNGWSLEGASWDHLSNGAPYTLDEVPPLPNWMINY